MPKTLDTEVVIIGGGAAGAYAAFKLNHRKIKVLMLVKGIVGRSGCTIFVSHLSVALMMYRILPSSSFTFFL